MPFYRLILRHPWRVIAIMVAVTLFLGWQMRKVELNNSIEALLPEGHPAVLQDHEIKQVFQSREMILVGILNEEGIFQPGTLEKVKDLTEAVWQLTIVGQEDEQALAAWGEQQGGRYREQVRRMLTDRLTAADRAALSNLLVEARRDSTISAEARAFLEVLQLRLSPVSDVISLAGVDNITVSESGLRIDPPMTEVPRTRAALDRLAQTVFDNEMYVNGLVSADSTGTVLLVELAFYYDDYLELAHRLFERLDALAAPYRGPEQVLLAGVPMVNVYTSNYMGGDLARLMPLVIALLMVVLYLALRTFQGVLLPLAVVLVALVWTLGIMGLLGRQVTMVVSIMPIILIAVGIADGIHLLTEYHRQWAELQDKDQAILATMRHLSLPVIFTSLTDMAGFGSLTISSLRSIKDFGLFTSIGVFAALVFSLVFIPAALKLMKPPEAHFGRSPAGSNRLTRILEAVGAFALRRRRWVLAGTALLVIVSAVMIPQIDVGSTMVGYYKKDSEIYRASEVLNAKFGGTEVLNIVVDTGRPDGLKDPEVLALIAAMQDTLEANQLVGYTTSLADYVKRINRVMHEDEPAYSRIPGPIEYERETEWVEVEGERVEQTYEVEVSGRNLIAQYLLLYENAGGRYLEKLSDFDYSKANVVAQIRTDHTPLLREVRQAARAFATARFGPGTHVTFAGCSNLCIVGDDLIIPGQLKSLGLALAVVLVLLVIVFRSVRRGLIGLSPLVMTVLAVFLLLSLFGVALDAVTALIASIVLGIGIDYSVHFLLRFRSLRQAGHSVEAAIRGTMDRSGRAIVFNSLAVAIGFTALLASSFWPIIHIGWIVAANMVIGAAFALVLLPALLHARPAQPAPREAHHEDR